jgi:hypothetical protein
MAEHCLEYNFNFIFVSLPTSHPALYDWVAFTEANEEVKTTQQRVWNGRYFDIWDYRYLNQVPLREQQPVLLVN